MVAKSSDERRREEAAQLLQYLGNASYGLGWQPALNDSGKPVLFPGSEIEITTEVVAACAREGDVFGRGRTVVTEVAQDVALALRGQAVLAATPSGGTR